MVRKEEIGAMAAIGARYNRRRLLKAGAAASGMAAFGMIPSTIRAGKFVQANATLNVLAPLWPQGGKEAALAEEWSTSSGIAVNFEAVNYGSLEQRVKILVESSSADYDIYDYDSQWIGGFVTAGGTGTLERLDTPDYLGNAASTVKATDFFPEIFGPLCQYPAPAFGEAGTSTSPVYGLPWSLNCEVLWYRKDLTPTAPATWEELRAKAMELTTDSMYGYAVQGGRDADWIISETNPIMWGNGGELWDPATYTAQGILNSASNIASLQFLVDMVNTDKSIDPASANWTINERFGALTGETAAMCLNWSPLFGGAADGPDSPVAGKIGYAVSPAGSVRQAAMIGCQGTAINSFSTKKAEAWQYLQYWQSKETQAAMQADLPSGFVSARSDLRDAVTEEWQTAFLDSIPVLRDMWNTPEYAQLLQILQTELNLAYVGLKSSEDALNDAALAQQQVLDSAVKPV